MNTGLGRYANELISLTVMALMVSALIAGQANATVHAAVRSDAGFVTQGAGSPGHAEAREAVVRPDIVIEIGIDGLTTFGVGIDTSEVLLELMRTQFKDED